MRCYFMCRGHIADVEFLSAGSDEKLIEQANEAFRNRKGRAYDGFEVWDGARRLHVHPPETVEKPESD